MEQVGYTPLWSIKRKKLYQSDQVRLDVWYVLIGRVVSFFKFFLGIQNVKRMRWNFFNLSKRYNEIWNLSQFSKSRKLIRKRLLFSMLEERCGDVCRLHLATHLLIQPLSWFIILIMNQDLMGGLKNQTVILDFNLWSPYSNQSNWLSDWIKFSLKLNLAQLT